MGRKSGKAKSGTYNAMASKDMEKEIVSCNDEFEIGFDTEDEGTVNYEGELMAALDELKLERAKSMKLTKELQIAKELCSTLRTQTNSNEQVKEMQTRLQLLLNEKAELESSYQVISQERVDMFECFSGKIKEECKAKEAALKELANLRAKMQNTEKCTNDKEVEELEAQNSKLKMQIKELHTIISYMEQNEIIKDEQIESLAINLDATLQEQEQFQMQSGDVIRLKEEIKELKHLHEVERQGMTSDLNALNTDIATLEENAVNRERQIKVLVKLLEDASSELQKPSEQREMIDGLQKQVKELECRCTEILTEKQNVEKQLREITDKFEVVMGRIRTYEKMDASTKKLNHLLGSSQKSQEKVGLGYVHGVNSGSKKNDKAPVFVPASKISNASKVTNTAPIKNVAKDSSNAGKKARTQLKTIICAPLKQNANTQKKGSLPAPKKIVHPYTKKVSNFYSSNLFDGFCYYCNRYGHKAVTCKFAQPIHPPVQMQNQFGYLAELKTCYICGDYGHLAAACRLKKRPAAGLNSYHHFQKDVVCYSCGIHGHVQSRCPNFYKASLPPKKTFQKSKAVMCDKCNNGGHVRKDCRMGDLNSFILQKLQEFLESKSPTCSKVTKSTKNPKMSKQPIKPKNMRHERKSINVQKPEYAWKPKATSAKEANLAIAKVDVSSKGKRTQATKRTPSVDLELVTSAEKSQGQLQKRKMNCVETKKPPLKCSICTKDHFTTKCSLLKRRKDVLKRMKTFNTAQASCSQGKSAKVQNDKEYKIKKILPQSSIDRLRAKLCIGGPILF